MFFSISTEKFDSNFLNHNQENNFYISVDNGWNKKNIQNTIIYSKGYCDDKPLEDILQDFLVDPTPKYNGNFCVIIIEKDKLIITHDVYRSFGLYEDKNGVEITNLPKKEDSEYEKIWSDRYTVLEENKFDYVFWDIPYKNTDFSKRITVDEYVSDSVRILKDKTNQLPYLLDQTNKPINVYLSGGVDTMMTYSIIEDYFGKKSPNYRYITGEHFELTEFIMKNNFSFKNDNRYQLYKQIHHWGDPSVLSTGTCGDEIFMRGPYTAALWCAWHDFNVVEILKNNDSKDYYHRYYFLNEKNQKTFMHEWNNRKEIQKLSYNELCTLICDMISNDHQHWHLENTLTWTPLKDMRLLISILMLPAEDLLDQILNGSIDRKIISASNPDLVNYISSQKNANQYENLLKFEKYMESVNNAEL